MSHTVPFAICVLEAHREQVDETRDYEEAVMLCRALVAEDGYAQAEVWQGEQLHCTVYHLHGRVCLREEWGAGTVEAWTGGATSDRTRRAVPDREVSRPAAPPLADARGEAARPAPADAWPARSPNGSPVPPRGRGAARPVILGNDPTQVTRWLGG